MSKISRTDFIAAIEAGIDACSAIKRRPILVASLRDHGRTATQTLVGSWWTDECGCPLMATGIIEEDDDGPLSDAVAGPLAKKADLWEMVLLEDFWMTFDAYAEARADAGLLAVV